MEENKRGNRKTRVGVVLSDKMQKTCIIGVTRRVRHALYGKYITLTSKFMVHDEEKKARVGDVVRIMETRPLSRRKRWRLVEVVKPAESREVAI